MSKPKTGNLVQVPDILIANPKLSSSVTFLYVCIKLKSPRQKDNSFKLNIYKDNFLEFIQWTQRTMKKHLSTLEKLGIVLDYKILKFKPMQIHIKPILKKNYTQVDINTIYKILETASQVKTKKGLKNFREQAVRLYYYYEKNVSNKHGYAYPTMDQTKMDCKISKDTINYLNKHFKKQKILYIEHGKKMIIDQNGTPRKENNRYLPLCKGRKY